MTNNNSLEGFVTKGMECVNKNTFKMGYWDGAEILNLDREGSNTTTSESLTLMVIQ